MKKLKAAGILAVLMVWLTACGSGADAEQETVNSLTLDKDGSVEKFWMPMSRHWKRQMKKQNRYISL